MGRGLLVFVLLGWSAPAGADFAPQGDAWHGLGQWVTSHGAEGIELQLPELLDWSRLAPSEPVLLVYPRSAVDLTQLRAFLGRGGRALVADEPGQASALIDAFALRPVPAPSSATAGYLGNGALPSARPLGDHPLGSQIEALVTNHPGALAGAGRPVLGFSGTEIALARLLQVGDGQLLVLADPSVLINNMQGFPGNRRLGRNLLEWACAGHLPCRPQLFSGRFESRLAGADRAAPKRPLQADAGWLGFEVKRLDRDSLWLLSLALLGLALLALVAVIPGGMELAWPQGAPRGDLVRPDPLWGGLRALTSTGLGGDGRLLASLVGLRAGRVLGWRRGDESGGALFRRLASRSDRTQTLAQLASLAQGLEETPLRSDPMGPCGRSWTVAQALSLDAKLGAVEGSAGSEESNSHD